jgi:hypothetical protein
MYISLHSDHSLQQVSGIAQICDLLIMTSINRAAPWLLSCWMGHPSSHPGNFDSLTSLFYHHTNTEWVWWPSTMSVCSGKLFVLSCNVMVSRQILCPLLPIQTETCVACLIFRRCLSLCDQVTQNGIVCTQCQSCPLCRMCWSFSFNNPPCHLHVTVNPDAYWGAHMSWAYQMGV